jgi:hypothetical protein
MRRLAQAIVPPRRRQFFLKASSINDVVSKQLTDATHARSIAITSAVARSWKPHLSNHHTSAYFDFCRCSGCRLHASLAKTNAVAGACIHHLTRRSRQFNATRAAREVTLLDDARRIDDVSPHVRRTSSLFR